MGNQPSSSSDNAPPHARYQSSTIPDSFFSTPTTTEIPPPYTSHSSVKCAGVSDRAKVVFRSADQDYFALDRKDVEAHTGALLPDDESSRSMIDLPESSTILRMLFEFIGARKHPKLLNEKFDLLAEVAKAAEKYKIFSAMNTCSERMRSFGDRHPKLVLLYAAHNDYPHIFDECAPFVVTSERLEDIIPLLPETLRLPWLRYHARWSQALTDITTYTLPFTGWSSWVCWKTCGQVIYHALATGVHSLSDPSKIFNANVSGHTGGCKSCRDLCSGWHTHTNTTINKIGAFSETCVTDPPPAKA
ncbi:hypothetical protein Agabi119p4_2285 [Agaricus bisporus var. burnettii]|uniref:BTB domain-containing protein n=1 Tax=Agaricus bisporus var. burnettii TaxID=192524 RepID=A0A8H7KJT6_AGABI|nr:hypothetical protein Agabi119p4_2285 [Agaricus bisporus var. burnettii]